LATEAERDLVTRRQQELFLDELSLLASPTGRINRNTPEGLHINPRGYEQHLPKLDYAGLEARVMAGFFTTDGRPTPAFWGFISQYVKKSGHTMLDILHDQEIYAPEQLQRALDIDSQIEDMTQEQRIALLRRITNVVYDNAITDPTGPGANVSDGE
jgi:hypothetical protein